MIYVFIKHLVYKTVVPNIISMRRCLQPTIQNRKNVQFTLTKDKEKQQILTAEKLKLEDLGHFEIKDGQNSCHLLVDFLIRSTNRQNLFKENREIFKYLYLPQI